MLTGGTDVTGGDAYIRGWSIVRQQSKALALIGYCPQFDALYDELTAREHLTMYATFRGIPLAERSQVIF